MSNLTDKNHTRKILLVQLFTLVRIPLAILLAAILTLSDHISYEMISFCVFLAGAIEITDMFDGYLARRIGVVTEWGAMLDPYADSTSRLISFWAFAVSGLVNPLVPLTMAFRDITVAYCRITLTRSGRSVSAKSSGKIKAVFQGVGAVVVILGPVYWPWTGKWTIQALSWLLILVTLASIFEYASAAISAAMDQYRKKGL